MTGALYYHIIYYGEVARLVREGHQRWGYIRGGALSSGSVDRVPKISVEGELFGRHLRELRVEAARQLAQLQLAELCDSNEPFISDLERGVKIRVYPC